MNYYTYAYLREDRTPYYVGKGRGNRIYSTDRITLPPKDKLRVIFLKQNLTEEDAFKHEIYMIALYGRKDLGTGILRNKTNGGEGASGAIRTSETRARISAAQKGEKNHNCGRKHSPESRAKMSAAKRGKLGKGKSPSPEHRAKLSAANKGKSFSPEHRARISAAQKGEKNHNYGKMWITNGIQNHMIPKNNIIPEGYRKGLIP